MGKEVDGVYPLRFAIAGQKFFIEDDAPFGVDASSRVAWGPLFDGAVDLFILKAFIDQFAIACDSDGGVPAVDVSLLWIQGVGEEVHRWLADTFGDGAGGTMIRADKVPLSGK